MRKFFIILTALAAMAFMFAGAVYSEDAANHPGDKY